jgi:hypothetical protein
VLATTTHHSTGAPWGNGVVMPYIWKKEHGQGRVFYPAPGHQVHEFLDVPAQLEIPPAAWLGPPGERHQHAKKGLCFFSCARVVRGPWPGAMTVSRGRVKIFSTLLRYWSS